MQIFSSWKIPTLMCAFRQNSNLHFDLQSTAMDCTFTKSCWRPFFLHILGTLSGIGWTGPSSLDFAISVGAVETVGDWAEKRRVLSSSPVTDPNWKVVLVAGEVPGHLQSTAEVPLSSLPKPQMLRAPVWGSLLTLCHLPQYMCMCSFVFKKINKVYLLLIYRWMCRPFPKQLIWHKKLLFNSSQAESGS